MRVKAIRDRFYSLLEKAQGGDKASQNIDRFLGFLIVANILAVTLESVDALYLAYSQLFFWFEAISVAIFAVEYGLRVWVAASSVSHSSHSDFQKRARYIFSTSGLIDLAAILPALLPIVFAGIDLRWIRVLRLLRIFKISHYSSALEDFFSAIYYERNAFAGALYLFCVTLFMSSSLMYLAEHQHQPAHFASIPETLWWSLITLTTVGYGDVAPISGLGKVIGGFTAIMGVCVVALLTGIVANAFAAQQRRRTGMIESEIGAALEDGIITEEEMKKIQHIQRQLNMDDAHLKDIIELMKLRNRT